MSERRDAVLVCGLGSLGLHCVRALQSYEVPVRGVDILPLEDQHRESDLADLPFVQGDCRYFDVLKRASLASCRAVLFVTGETHANVEGALAARRLDPSIRIVARTAESNINQLLSSLLGNFVAYQPYRLAASAYALAALRGEIIGYFHLEDRLLRVVRRTVAAKDPWVKRPVGQVNAHGVAVLRHVARSAQGSAQPAPAPARASSLDVRPGLSGPQLLYGYDPTEVVQEGDELTLLVGAESGINLEQAGIDLAQSGSKSEEGARARRAQKWPALTRTGAVALGAFVVIVAAVGLAMILYPGADPSLSGIDGFFTALVLMTGGTYADLFPAFHQLSNGLRLFSVLLSVLGTVAVGLLYAWLTDQLMKLRLRFSARRPRPPRAGHVVVVGLGRAGRQAAEVLNELGRSVAAVDLRSVEDYAIRSLAVVKGDGTERATLEAGGMAGARGLLAATDNDWTNLEIALLARELNPQCELVIRTKDTRFSDNVAAVVPNLQVVCAPVIAARAFAIAALGDRVLDLFRLAERTVYVIEYQVDGSDGLDGRLLGEIAEGYSVMPVLHESPGHAKRFWSPIEHAHRVKEGDRLVLFGPSESLQRIERSQMLPRRAVLTLQELRPYADKIALAAVLAQQLAYPLEQAQTLVSSLPAEIPDRLYPLHAQRLRGLLERSGMIVELSV